VTTLPKGDWYEVIAMPIYSALDNVLEPGWLNKTNEERWAQVLKECPWLIEACQAPAAEPVAEEPGGALLWTALKSTNLDAFRVVGKMQARADGTVDPWAMDIQVRFKNGDVWRYAGVPQEHVFGLSESESPGGYFAVHIKGKYPEEKVNAET